MHLAKGLEFRAVGVMACDDEIIPLQERIETVGDDADLKEVYDTERHLRGNRLRQRLPLGDGNSDDRTDTVSVFNGPPPAIQRLKSQDEEITTVANWIARHAKTGVMPHEVGLFVRSRNQLDRAQAVAKKAGVPFKVLDEKVETTSGHISIGTMHLAKGLAGR
jgi:superfamily I DNA/RNA helicase